jgi:hypothetical protein
MVINKDGSPRKKRENAPTNYKWDDLGSLLAFLCYKSGFTQYDLIKVAEKLEVSLSSLRARMNEYQIIENYGKTEKVTKLSVSIYEANNFRSSDECERKLELFLGEAPFYEMEHIEELTGLPESTFANKGLIEELSIEHPLIKLVKTDDVISQFLASGQVEFNGPYINSNNLILLEGVRSLDFLEAGMEGCYFIFSTIPEELIPVLSKDGLKCYRQYLEKDGIKYRCLYNGKGNNIRERLKLHLYNPFTLEKIKNNPGKTISGTGAMSLSSHPAEVFTELEKKGQFNPAKHKLKPVEKSIQECSIEKRQGHQYFLNGIDIHESPWNSYKFAMLIVRSDSEFGKILIEEAFCLKNGRPPLCKRHG